MAHSWLVSIFQRKQPALVGIGLSMLMGCAAVGRADVITFDRGAFALAYADFTASMRVKCEMNPTTVPCVKFATLDDRVRKAITEPAASPGGDPINQLLPLIMKLAPLLQ